MNQDKSTTGLNSPEILFNWEQVKKQAKKKIDELVCNAPKITKREELVAIRNQTERLVKPMQIGREITTDTPIDPPDIKPEYTTFTNENSTPNSGDDYTLNNTDHIQTDYIDTDTDQTDKTNGTPTPQLLAAAPPQGSTQGRSEYFSPEVECGELMVRGQSNNEMVLSENLGPDTNAIDLLKRIKQGEVVGSELQQDERLVVVRALRMNGQTQDAIASFLQLSRRTIVSDCKRLRELAALEIQSTETSIIAGEIYTTARAAIQKALAKGHLKTVSTLMRDMVELLQSMGMVYRAPKTSMQATMHGSLNRSKGYQKYISTIGEDSDKVVEVLDCMFNAISEEQL